MYLYFDESGDYAFPADRFDCYVQAALITPDSVLPSIATFVEQHQADWDVQELHAAQLEPDQLVNIARFIGASSCQLLVHPTDTVLLTKDQIAQFRLDQAAGLKRNLDWYRRESTKARGGPVAEIEDWMLRHIKRAGLHSQISHGEFVQAHYLVNLIADALQKSLYVFFDDAWRNDFHEFHFILDAKLPNKMAAGEKYLNDSILPVLGSRRHTSLGHVDTWNEDPVHPFVTKFSLEQGRIAGETVEGLIDLGLIFEHGCASSRLLASLDCSWWTRSRTSSGRRCCARTIARFSERTTRCATNCVTSKARALRSIASTLATPIVPH